MSETLAFRPRFKFRSPLTVEEITTRVKTQVSKANGNVLLKKVHGHLDLSFPKKKQHFWSPHMDIGLEKDPESDLTIVRCLIAPMPAVWTMFVFFYAFFALVALGGTMVGYSQWSLDHTPWALWLVLGAGLAIGGLYFASYEGKHLARKEMEFLKNFVDEALGCDCLALAEEG